MSFVCQTRPNFPFLKYFPHKHFRFNNKTFMYIKYMLKWRKLRTPDRDRWKIYVIRRPPHNIIATAIYTSGGHHIIVWRLQLKFRIICNHFRGFWLFVHFLANIQSLSLLNVYQTSNFTSFIRLHAVQFYLIIMYL